MKKIIIRKVIALVASLLLIITVIMIISSLLIKAKERDEKILQKHQDHIDLIKWLQVEFTNLSLVTHEMSQLSDVRLLKQEEKKVEGGFVQIHKLSTILRDGGKYTRQISVNYNNTDIFSASIEYYPNSKEQLLEMVELQPRLNYMEQISFELLEEVKLYYQNDKLGNYYKAKSNYKQLESLIRRSVETTNRAFITASELKKNTKIEMEERKALLNIFKFVFISVLLIIVFLFLRQVLKQIIKIVDKHEEATLRLEESNKTIQKILDSLPVGIALANRKQEIKHINKTALKLIKDTQESNYVDSHCSKVFCLEDEEHCPITSNGLAIHDIELGLIQADGNKKTILKSAIPVRLDNEDMILEAFMDISIQKDAVQALVDQKRYIDDVLNSVLVGVVVIEAETHKIFSVNKKAVEMIGDIEQNIVGQICNEYICPAKRGNCPITDLDIQVQNQQKILITAQGERKQILKSVKKTEINGKKVYVESFVDISDRVKAEDELRKLSRVVEESPASIVITDVNGIVEYVNPKLLENTGYTAEEVLGKSPSMFNAREIENKVDYKEMWETILGGEIWKGEFCNKGKDGRVFWELASISPVKDKNGIITHFVAIKDDITDRKEYEKKLTIERRKANSANKAKGFFLAKMSHEIRTPMNGIIGMTDLLLESIKSDEIKEKLKVISVSAENLLIIINEILDFSKIEAGQVSLESIPININDLLSEVKKLLHIKATKKGLYLKTQISKELPDYIVGDPTRIKQIIINLVNNAITFTKEGGVTILLGKKIIPSETDQFILSIRIIDTGSGISEEGKLKLFKAFSQTSASTTRTHGGTGLGLLISKELVESIEPKKGSESKKNYGKSSNLSSRRQYNQSKNSPIKPRKTRT
ncbi:MAG: hypothetical protein B7C24_04270 [Bacteroidetes bacterium 4572_77]|nr:MAG: hypothetical protein B7C24_04270 [Bacteroidetes bacterium 4572_77]